VARFFNHLATWIGLTGASGMVFFFLLQLSSRGWKPNGNAAAEFAFRSKSEFGPWPPHLRRRQFVPFFRAPEQHHASASNLQTGEAGARTDRAGAWSREVRSPHIQVIPPALRTAAEEERFLNIGGQFQKTDDLANAGRARPSLVRPEPGCPFRRKSAVDQLPSSQVYCEAAVLVPALPTVPAAPQRARRTDRQHKDGLVAAAPASGKRSEDRA
jgi:hypothetical protein